MTTAKQTVGTAIITTTRATTTTRKNLTSAAPKPQYPSKLHVLDHEGIYKSIQ